MQIGVGQGMDFLLYYAREIFLLCLCKSFPFELLQKKLFLFWWKDLRKRIFKAKLFFRAKIVIQILICLFEVAVKYGLQPLARHRASGNF